MHNYGDIKTYQTHFVIPSQTCQSAQENIDNKKDWKGISKIMTRKTLKQFKRVKNIDVGIG